MRPALVLGLGALLLAGGAAADETAALARLATPPLGLPPVPLPAGDPPTAETIGLGRKLFFDRRLSVNGTMSCAMCHVPEQGFTSNELKTPVGVEGRSLRRNAPTVLNAAYPETMFHDGRDRTLEEQALRPLTAHDEMANPSLDHVVARIAALADYHGRFEAAFDEGPSAAGIARALAAFQRTLLAAGAPFDHWRFGGEADALTPDQVRGFALFTGRAGCSGCHLVGEAHALFTDHRFHDTGIGHARSRAAADDAPVMVELAPGVRVPVARAVLRTIGDPPPPDDGRAEATGDPADRWRYKTPSLRNVVLTAPYMHDGSIATLDEVVRYYVRGGTPHPGQDPRLRPLDLDEDEIGALVAFLESLTAGNIAELIAEARSEPPGS
jgi:cytochrome c peroxidase